MQFLSIVISFVRNISLLTGSFQSRSPKAVNEGSSISFKFSPFVTISEISISWKFQLYTYYQSIFVQFEIFGFFIKVEKFELEPILEVNFLKIEFLEASSPNFPGSSVDCVPGSAKIISWTFGIRKNKVKCLWKFFKI